jgi:hypothetical protein
MAKPKDAKIWNEDLVRALDARHQQSQRDGKRDVHMWRTGRDKLLAVRKDIYQFRTGTIVNLPDKLTKRVHRLCEDVIRGVKSVYPDGHVPTDNGTSAALEITQSSGAVQDFGVRNFLNPSTPISNPAYMVALASITKNSIASTTGNNPFRNDNYMKNMKIRSGAFAILMAFRYSLTEIMTKRDICRESQKFCDSQMEANWHAGRTYGGWKGIDTLKSKNFVMEQGYATYTPRGFRDRPHSFSLTRDGEMFIEALLAYRPEAVEAARQASGRDPRTLVNRTVGTTLGTPASLHRPAGNVSIGLTPTPVTSSNKSANMEADGVELKEWIATASVGDRKDFRVGRERRFRLHNLCDALQQQKPGLLLTHSSSGAARSRIMSIQLVSTLGSMSVASIAKPDTSGRKRPYSPSWFDSGEYPETTQSSSSLTKSGETAREQAGLAAARRQEQAREEIELKTAILESKKMAATPLSSRKFAMKRIKRQQRCQNRGDYGDGDKAIQKAIQASLKEKKKPPSIKRDIFAIDESSDDELPMFSPSPIPKKRKTKPLSEAKKPPAKNRGEICCIDSDSDSDNDILPRRLIVSPRDITGRKNNSANQQKKPMAVTSKKFHKTATLHKKATASSINLCESSESENEDDVIEITKGLEEPIDLSNSQLPQDPNFIRESLKEPIDLSSSQLSQDLDCTREILEEPIDLSNSQLSQDPNCVDTGTGSFDGDEIMIVENAMKTPEPTLVSEKILSPNGRCSRNNATDVLTVWIDSRERNRNATPRMLRMELTRHLATGPLSDVWPSTLPPGRVEEAGLEWGDIQYSVQCSNNSDEPKRRLGVSIERKRVNDLVQRSSRGDHLVQLFRMKQHCSLSVLLIENDTRTARNVTPYNALDNEGFDPMDPTIRCEDDVYRMFGRILMSCDSIKFFQTRDEQASLRAIGALGLMAVFAPSKFTKELEDSPVSLASEERATTSNTNSKGAQALSDQLKQAGIPWRLAKRVSNVVGGPIELKSLYDSCCNETAKSQLLSYIINTGKDHDQGDMRSSATGWSDAIYHVITASSQSRSSDEKRLNGEAALMLHKELIEDHGSYLSTLYQGNSPEETLEKILNDAASSSPTREELAPRYVTISLTNNQATKYFPPTTSVDSAFYKLLILSDDQSISHSGAITMRTESRSFASNALSVFEFEGSDIVDLIRDSWSSKKGNFVLLAKLVARVVDNICHERGRGRSTGTKRILMVCGLQPALDANAKKSGYARETRTVVDLVFAELLLCYDMTILQASRKNSDDRVNLVKQLALACFHCGFLVQKCKS